MWHRISPQSPHRLVEHKNVTNSFEAELIKGSRLLEFYVQNMCSAGHINVPCSVCETAYWTAGHKLDTTRVRWLLEHTLMHYTGQTCMHWAGGSADIIMQIRQSVTLAPIKPDENMRTNKDKIYLHIWIHTFATMSQYRLTTEVTYCTLLKG